MRNGGLHFARRPDFEDWFHFTAASDDEVGVRLARLESLLTRRSAGHVVLAPRTISTNEIEERCLSVKSQQTEDDEFNPAYGLPPHFDRKWNGRTDRNKWIEGQNLVVCAFDEKHEFAGYAALDATLSARIRHPRAYYLHFELHLVYVLPSRRGLGFGLDLTVGAGILCGDLLRAAYSAIPDGSSITPTVHADCFSIGGIQFVESVGYHVASTRNSLRRQGTRSVRIRRLQVESDL